MKNIKVENQYFIQAVIMRSIKLWDINDSQGHFCLDLNKGHKFFFKRKQFPSVEGLQEKDAKSVLQITSQSLKNELLASQNGLSKYILPYQTMIISYPYACLTHQPFLDNLSNYMKKSLNFPAKVDLMTEIALGIADLHGKNIRIKGLKPSTIVLIGKNYDDFQIAFSDVRSAESVNSSAISKKMKIQQLNSYMAPELSQGESSSLACDIWSLGLIFYEILLGRKPNMFKLQDQGVLQFSSESPIWMRQFLERMITIQPKNRSKIKDILLFLKNAKLCSKELEKNYS